MNGRIIILAALVLTLLLGTAGFSATDKLSPSLGELVDKAMFRDTLVTVVVFLEDEAGYEALTALANRDDLTRAERINAVISQLTSHAPAGEAAVRDFLSANNITPAESHWIVPALTVTLPLTKANELAGMPEVRFVADDVSLSFDEPVSRESVTTSMAGHSTQLDLLGIPALWQRGLTGKNRLVCSFDTGVESSHPALAAKWRGTHALPSAGWFSPVKPDTLPYDAVGHGTHTMGIMVGSNATDTFGVAPDAEWITAGVIDQGRAFSTTLSDILNAFQWVLNPDGDLGTTDDVPDVILNSWGVPVGLLQPCDQTFWQAIDAVEAAGIVTIFAAGNEGPNPQTLRSPADRATTPLNSFSVGAVDNNRVIGGFSSRGPSRCDNTQIKPEIVAPGVNVYSSTKGGGYVYMTGTSMAAPYIAGMVALAREYNPDASVAQIKNALIKSSVDLGPTGEDNAYGNGLPNATAMLQNLPAPGGYEFVFSGTQIVSAPVALPGNDVDFRVVLITPASNVESASGHLTIAETPGVTVTLSDGVFFFGFGGTTALSTLPFSIHVDETVPHGTVVPCSLVVDVDEYTAIDTITFSLTIGYPAPGSIADHATQNIEMTVSDFGQLGVAAGSMYNLGGRGFTVNGSDNLLYEAGLLVGRNSLQLSGSIRDSLGNFRPSDFAPSQSLTAPSTSLEGAVTRTARMADTNSEIPVPVTIAQTSTHFQTVGDGGMIIMTYHLINTSAERQTHLSFGLLTDFDLPGGESAQVDNTGGLVYTSNAAGLMIGLQNLTGLNRLKIVPNGTGKTGFTADEKLELISSDAPWNAATTSDMMMLVAAGPYDLDAGDTVTLAVAFVVGTSTSELYANAALARRQFDIATNIADDDLTLPAQFELAQNYPNPFNPTTTISFSLPTASPVTLEIFNTLGQRVTVLTQNDLAAGEHKVVWDGTDDRGGDVASGVYFYRLSANGSHLSRKMMLLK
jgi:hypothetical protein